MGETRIQKESSREVPAFLSDFCWAYSLILSYQQMLNEKDTYNQ